MATTKTAAKLSTHVIIPDTDHDGEYVRCPGRLIAPGLYVARRPGDSWTKVEVVQQRACSRRGTHVNGTDCYDYYVLYYLGKRIPRDELWRLPEYVRELARPA